MTRYLRLTGLGLAALIATTGPAPAEEQGTVVLWDQHIASAVNQMLLGDRDCRRNPYHNAGRGCVANELDLSFDSGRKRELNILDRLVVFVDKKRRLDMERKLRGGTKIRLHARLATLTTDEAEVRLALGVHF